MNQPANGDPATGPAPGFQHTISHHLVHFYSEDESLLQTLQRVVGGALGSGNSAVVIATEKHRRALAKRLKWCGIDLQLVQACGRYQELDAAAILASLDGGNISRVFRELLENAIVRAENLKVVDYSRTLVFGEVVGLMWERNRPEDAIRLETLWNHSVDTHPCTLMCAYPAGSVFTPKHFEDFCEVCVAHSGVISGEAPVGVTPEGEHFIPARRAEPVASGWRFFYESAVREPDQRNLFQKLESAEAAVRCQLEAPDSSLPGEKQAFLNALAGLLILKKHKLGYG